MVSKNASRQTLAVSPLASATAEMLLPNGTVQVVMIKSACGRQTQPVTRVLLSAGYSGESTTEITRTKSRLATRGF